MTRPRYKKQQDVDRYIAKIDLSDGKSYQSALSVRDFNSIGICTRAKDTRTGRVQDYLSNGEYGYQELVAFDQRIVRAQEQWPILPIVETLTIASELGIAHPQDRGFHLPVRTDCLVGLRPAKGKRVEDIIIEVKESPKHFQGRKGPRREEKLRLVETWCSANQKRFCLLYKSDLQGVPIQNLRWLRYGLHAWQLRFNAVTVGRFAECFSLMWMRNRSATLDSLALQASKALAIEQKDALRLFQIAVWRRLILLDLKVLVLPGRKLLTSTDQNMGVIFPW